MRRWKQRFRRYRALTDEDRRFYHRVWWMVLRVRLGLCLLSYTTWRTRWLSTPPSSAPDEAPDSAYLERVSWAVRHSSRFVPGARTCLVQAIAAYRLLRPRGYPVQIEIGATHDENGALQAHAWVRCGDEIVIGDEDEESVAQKYETLGGLSERSVEPSPAKVESPEA